MPRFYNKITEYSGKYTDDTYEYRHVTLCKADYDRLPFDYKDYYDPCNRRRM